MDRLNLFASVFGCMTTCFCYFFGPLLECLLLQTIVTGAGDETLRFWNVFPSPKYQVFGVQTLMKYFVVMLIF